MRVGIAMWVQRWWPRVMLGLLLALAPSAALALKSGDLGSDVGKSLTDDAGACTARVAKRDPSCSAATGIPVLPGSSAAMVPSARRLTRFMRAPAARVPRRRLRRSMRHVDDDDDSAMR